MKYFWIFATLGLMSCGTTPMLLRSVDFMSPHVSDKPFSGYLRTGVDVAPVQVITATNATPPVPATDVNFKQDVYPIGFFDIGLSLLPRFEVYSIDKGFGGKLQFWGSDEGGFEAAVKTGLLYVKYSTKESVTYSATGTETGLSMGYRTSYLVPYLSFVKKTYAADTTTPSGSNTNKVSHLSKSIGLQFLNWKSTSKIQFSGILEFAMTDADWQPNYSYPSNTMDTGISLGIGW